MKIFYLIPISLILFFTTCKTEPDYTLKGTFTNVDGQSLYLEKAGFQGFQTVNTAVLKADGEFVFTFPVNEIGYYRLRIGSTQSIILIIDKDESVSVKGNGLNLGREYTVEGSKNSALYRDFLIDYQKSIYAIDSLKQVGQKVMQTTKDMNQIMQLQQLLNNLAMKQVDQSKKYIDDNINSFVALSIIESLDMQQEMEYYKKVQQSMLANYPNSASVQSFSKRIEAMEQQAAKTKESEKRIAIGAIPPEINMDDPNGNKISLSSLKGKFVLVDFWASWCKPCRMESPNLVRLYKEYNAKGFEIYSVSLDKNKGAWVNAIKQDQLDWIHVSDLAFWQSTAVSSYGFSGIPFTVLLDREGKIIAKNLRGNQLAQKLKEIIS